MKVSKTQLLAAAQAADVAPERAEALWGALRASEAQSGSSYSGVNVAYYFGGFLIIGAMTFFMAEGWLRFGAWFGFVAALAYLIGFALAGARLYASPATRTPGGALVTAAVATVPLTIYCLEVATGRWQSDYPGGYANFYAWVNGSWIWMELGTIVASAIALRWIAFPLITLPAAFGLWFLSMDGTAAIAGKHDDFDLYRHVAVVFGLVMLAASVAIDRRTKEDFAFWGYLYGAITLFTGLSLLWNGELRWLAFAVISLLAIVVSIILGRRVLLIFGVFGLVGYLGYLAFGIFKLSFGFSVALTTIGIAVIAAGVWYQRNEARVQARLMGVIPARIVALLPASRAT